MSNRIHTRYRNLFIKSILQIMKIFFFFFENLRYVYIKILFPWQTHTPFCEGFIRNVPPRINYHFIRAKLPIILMPVGLEIDFPKKRKNFHEST